MVTRGMKYIAFEGRLHQEVFIFANSRDHQDAMLQMHIKSEDMISAGFVVYDALNGMRCYGESHSLGLKSRGQQDTDLINKLMAM